MLEYNIVFLLVIIVNIFLTRKVFRLFYIYRCHKNNDVKLSIQVNRRNFIIEVFIISTSIILLTVFSIWFGKGSLYLASFLVFLLFQFLHQQTTCKKEHIITQKKLTLGYGNALWYYKNYLDRILEVHGQSEAFSTRVKEFMSMQKVKVPEKLYILCPRSCKVQKYIDNTCIIDRCRELTPYTNDNSGIVKREYNITVYRIQHPLKLFRCAIEYAQPLKSFRRFKEMGRITESDMQLQRELFSKHLRQFLKESNTAYKLCELVEFDDEKEEIHDVLYNVESIQRFLKEGS